MVFFVWGCLGPRTPIVHPDNPRLLAWILCGLLFILYEVFITPYRLCFNAPAMGPMFALETVINVYFICDVCLNFFVSSYDKEGQVVQSHATIIRGYVRGWFIIDFTASVPVDWIRTRLNNIEYFPPNFEGLVLGCIDADFCK